MWNHTQMITSFVISAGLYAVLLYVFTLLPLTIIPGVTSARPANAIPPVMSLLFGPAAAWGTAVGNLIGFDILGGNLTIGSIGGFIGNLFLGYVPYKIWHRVFKEEPHLRTLSSFAKFELVIIVHAAAVALIIPLWVEALGFLPFTFLAFIIFFNELLAAGILGPIIMVLIFNRVKRAGYLWTDSMKEYEFVPKEVKSSHRLGASLLSIGAVVGLVVTIAVGLGLGQQLLSFTPAFGLTSAGLSILATGGVFLVIFFIGVALLR